jgi:hypothetical protein
MAHGLGQDWPGMDKLTLFGISGLERGRGGSGGLGMVVDEEGRHRHVQTSYSITFNDPAGQTITVTSQHLADNEKFETIRRWAPMNTYLATPEGKDQLRASRDDARPLDPIEVDWRPARIAVDGKDTAFEVCDLYLGWWVGVGRVPHAVITIGSQGVPLGSVRLEHVDEHPVPALPDLGDMGEDVLADLEPRFMRLPVRRVRGRSDYWALHSVEEDHVRNLARKFALSDRDQAAVRAHWMARVEAELADTNGRLRVKDIDAASNSRIARRLIGRHLLYNLWSNTVGPGAKCWFGNRYAPIRHYTFRLRWRP